MSKSITKRQIKVMQAYVDGYIIKSGLKSRGGFSTDDNPAWNWKQFDYIVAKQPTGKDNARSW